MKILPAAANIMIILGLSEYNKNTYSAAPPLFAAGSIFIHQFTFDKNNVYLLIVGLQVLSALHFDFIAPSYI